MKRMFAVGLIAGLIAVVSPSAVEAGITYTTTPFSGTTTALTGLSGSLNGSGGTSVGIATISSTNSADSFSSANGLILTFPSDSSTDTITFTLSTPVYSLGFDFNTAHTSPDVYFSQAAFDSDSSLIILGGLNSSYSPYTQGFIGFTDTTTFSSVQLTFIGNASSTLDVGSFVSISSQSSSVPEPSSLALCGISMVVATGAMARRRSKSRLPLA